MSSIWTNALILDGEKSLIQTFAAPLLASNRVLEYTNDVVLTESLLLSQLVEASYDGYARGSIASWVGPSVDLQGNNVVTPSVPVAFSCSGNLTINTVKGYGVLDSTGATLLAAVNFPTPISPIPGQVHHVTPALVMQGTVDSCLC